MHSTEMTSLADRQRKLTSLLREALSNIRIQYSGFDAISIESYRQYMQQCRSTTAPGALYSRMYLYTTGIHIADRDKKAKLIKWLEEDLRQFLYEGKLFTVQMALHGGSGGGIPVEKLLNQGLMRVAIVKGAEQASEAFYDCIRQKQALFQSYSLINGIQVEEETRVMDGVSLIPLPKSTALLPSYLPQMLLSEDSRHLLSRTLLRVNCSIKPAFLKPNPEKHFSLSGPGVMDDFKRNVYGNEVDDLHFGKLYQALSLITGHPTQSVLGWEYFDPEHVLNIEGIGGSYSHTSGYYINPQAANISLEQIQEAVRLYKQLVNLPAEVDRYLQIPLQRWIASLSQGELVDSVIDLGIALESFYLSDTREELSYRFRLRAALFLGTNLEERKNLKEEFQIFYNQRSKAVHQGRVDTHIGENQVEAREFIKIAQQHFRLSLLKVIESKQKPNWSVIELSGGTD